MDNLKVIESELVPVYETDKGDKVVYGKDLHKTLGVKTDFSSWVKRRLNDCDAVEKVDYDLLPKIEEHASGAKHSIEYVIKLDIAKEMAMLERNKKGKEVRRYFIRVEEKYKNDKQIPATIQGQIQLLAQGNVEINQRIDQLDNKLEKAIADLPILGIEENRISNAIKTKGMKCLGGKGSNAYKDKSVRGRLYCDMHRQLRREFGVSTYKAIKRSQCDTAVTIINGYAPPLVLSETIETLNNQQSLNLKGGE